jgi:hypothetical protein
MGVQKYFDKYRIAIRTKNILEIECYDTNASSNNPVENLRFYQGRQFSSERLSC